MRIGSYGKNIGQLLRTLLLLFVSRSKSSRPFADAPTVVCFATVEVVSIWTGPTGFIREKLFEVDIEYFFDYDAHGETKVFWLSPPIAIPQKWQLPANRQVVHVFHEFLVWQRQFVSYDNIHFAMLTL